MKPQTHLTTFPAGASAPNGTNQFQSLNDDPAIAGFLAARETLQQRRQELEVELVHIQKLLEGETNLPGNPVGPPPISAPAQPSSPLPRHSNAGLRQAVIGLLTHGPLTKDQIIARLRDQKFEFFGQPKPALDAVLYTKKFRREGKLFGLAVDS